jgi:hypothetical protein
MAAGPAQLQATALEVGALASAHPRGSEGDQQGGSEVRAKVFAGCRRFRVGYSDRGRIGWDGIGLAGSGDRWSEGQEPQPAGHDGGAGGVEADLSTHATSFELGPGSVHRCCRGSWAGERPDAVVSQVRMVETVRQDRVARGDPHRPRPGRSRRLDRAAQIQPPTSRRPDPPLIARRRSTAGTILSGGRR